MITYLVSDLAKWIIASTLVAKFVKNKFNANNDDVGELHVVDEEQNNAPQKHFSKNVIDAFDLIVTEVEERRENSLLNMRKSIDVLRKKYFDGENLIKDILSYIDSTDNPRKEFIKGKIEHIKGYLEFLISDSEDVTLVDFFFNSRNETYADYVGRLSEIYEVLLNDKNNRKGKKTGEKTEGINSYLDLLDETGNIYNGLVDYYLELSLIPNRVYNHELVYDMAGYILHETDFYFCRDLSQRQLAEDITNYIFKYIHGESLADKLIEQRRNGVQINVEEIYKHYLGFA